MAGLIASVFHLGQPRRGWRVWLGWRTSWLSREAIALNLFVAVAVGALVLLWLPFFRTHVGLPEWLHDLLARINAAPAAWSAAAVLLTGLAALGAQTMVYADTRHHFWRVSSTAPRFFGTALVVGLAALFALNPSPLPAALLALTTLLKLASEVSVLKHAQSDAAHWTQLRRTAALQRGPLRPLLLIRLTLAALGGAWLPFVISTATRPAV